MLSALAEILVFIYICICIALLYFDLYIASFILCLLSVANEIQEFQVEILFEHFFDDEVDLRFRLRLLRRRLRRRRRRLRCC